MILILIERAASQVNSIGRKGQLPTLIYTSLDLLTLRWTAKAIILYIHVVCTRFQTDNQHRPLFKAHCFLWSHCDHGL